MRIGLQSKIYLPPNLRIGGSELSFDLVLDFQAKGCKIREPFWLMLWSLEKFRKSKVLVLVQFENPIDMNKSGGFDIHSTMDKNLSGIFPE